MNDYEALKKIQDGTRSPARNLMRAAITGRNLNDAVDAFVLDQFEETLALQQLAIKTDQASRVAEHIEQLTARFVATGRRDRNLCAQIAAENKLLRRIESEIDHLAAQIHTSL